MIPVYLDIFGNIATLSSGETAVSLVLPDSVPETHVSLLLLGSGGIDTQAPEFISGSVGPDPSTVTLVFSESITWTGSLGDGLELTNSDSDWHATLPGIDNTLTYVSGKGSNTLVFTIDRTIREAETILFCYNTNDVSSGNLRDATGNLLASFDYIALTNNASIPPTLDSVVVQQSGSTIVYTFNEAVSGTTSLLPTLSFTGGAVTLTYVSGSGSDTWTYSLSRQVLSGQSGTTSWTNDLQDIRGNLVGPVSAQSVVNQSDTTAPTISSASVDSQGSFLTVTYSESVLGGTTGAGGHTVSAGTSVALTYYSSTSNTRVYTTSRRFVVGEVDTLTYTSGGNGNITDASVNLNALATVSGISITNNSVVTVPTVTTASINTAGTQLTLTFSESVNNHTGFAITPSGGASGVTYSSGDGGTGKVFTLSRTINQGETVTLAYTAGNVTSVNFSQSLVNFSGTSVTNNSTHTAFTSFRLDFGTGNVQSGFTGFTTTAYAADPGYGWTSVFPDAVADRVVVVGATDTALFRDGAYSTSGSNVSQFKIAVPVGTSIDLRVYHYDPFSAWGAMIVKDVDSGSTLATPSNGASSAHTDFSMTDANNDGFVIFSVQSNNGSNVWWLNGIDAASTGNLPTART